MILLDENISLKSIQQLERHKGQPYDNGGGTVRLPNSIMIQHLTTMHFNSKLSTNPSRC